ncbi:helix-turn-helix domain-containing protein [Chitinophaga pendula]|uniref:helix-turn-helix domain-containing protein n=1 Tax=Chitinophaga pendula TaxID=2849666 RepID=UPI001CED00BC|nr:helix-turn-helix transcriptional regulator [Chitinophaga pendula]UCJ08650.1 helix-turn-helix domain-containing protein [Chitinophaga pendula]
MKNLTIHEGENLRKLRLIMGFKQRDIAHLLGEDWNQQKVSYLESSEKIAICTLKHIAIVLKIPVWFLQMPPYVFNNYIFKIQRQDNSCPVIYIIKIVELYERLLVSMREQYSV